MNGRHKDKEEPPKCYACKGKGGYLKSDNKKILVECKKCSKLFCINCIVVDDTCIHCLEGAVWGGR